MQPGQQVWYIRLHKPLTSSPEGNTRRATGLDPILFLIPVGIYLILSSSVLYMLDFVLVLNSIRELSE